MAQDEVKRSLLDLVRALRGALQAANQLVPGVIVVCGYLVVAIIFVAVKYSPLMVAVTILVVVGVSLMVYVTSKNYGEAALSLVAGLLTVFSVDWIPSRFVVFITVWMGFSFLALAIASVRIAAKTEAIYREASLALAVQPQDVHELEKELTRIGKEAGVDVLGPVENAETIRLLCYRKLSPDAIRHALKVIGSLSLMTKVEPKTIAIFVADLYRLLLVAPDLQYETVLRWVYSLIRETPVSPLEFIEAFNRSRRAILSGRVSAAQYFELLRLGLESGVPPEEMYEFIVSNNR